jgi:hypothetical protein
VEICTVGSVRGESVGAAMVDLNAGTKQAAADTAKEDLPHAGFSSTRRDVRLSGWRLCRHLNRLDECNSL